MFSKARTSLAAVGIATLAAATSAQAAVVVVEVNEVLKLTSLDPISAASSQYDLDGDGTDDIILTWDKAFDVRTMFTLDTKGAVPTGLAGILGAGDSLPAGLLVSDTHLIYFDGGSASSSVTGGGLAPLPNGGFVGIRFPGSGTLLEGWLQFAATGTTLDNAELTLVRYGYEDTGGPITMGAGIAAVPLPAAGLLLVGGIAALGAAGRRRRDRA
ncbi:MAG: hypothetical protein ACJAVR_002698 [Paracoccaceae bacterium]|jgi:hypothetical protein